jgi:hypothetical protein
MRKPFLLLFAFSIALIAIFPLSWFWKSKSTEIFTLSQNKVGPAPVVAPAPLENKIIFPVHAQPKFPSQVIDSESTHKIKILTEIFDSKNDNDPRLDKDFNHLSPHTKEALEAKYRELHPEARNERGTIVFLMGRNLNSSKDFEFFSQVIREQPCLSLGKCSETGERDNPEENEGVEITLQYPQIVALKSLELYLNKNPESASAIQVLREAMKSKSPVVRQTASSLLTKFQAGG